MRVIQIYFTICLLFLDKAVTGAGICITLNGSSTEFTISCEPDATDDVIVVDNVIHGYMDHGPGATCASQAEFECQQADFQDNLFWTCSGSHECTGFIRPQALTNCQEPKSVITQYSTHVFLDFVCVPRSDILNICDTGSLTRNGEIYIESPNYSSQTPAPNLATFPAQYTPETFDQTLSNIQICRCQISGPVYTTIELRTINFDLAPNESECPDEHIIIGNPSNSLASGKLCGSKYDTVWEATGNLMELEYFLRTDSAHNSAGFLLEARAEGFPGNAQIKVSCSPSELSTTLPDDGPSSPHGSSTDASTNSSAINTPASQSETPIAAIAGGAVAGVVVVGVIVAVIAFVFRRKKKSNVYEEPEKANPQPRKHDPSMKDNLAYVPTHLGSNPGKIAKDVDEYDDHIYEDMPVPFNDGKSDHKNYNINEKSQNIYHNNISNTKLEEPVAKRIAKGRENAYTGLPNQTSVKESPVYLSLIGD